MDDAAVPLQVEKWLRPFNIIKYRHTMNPFLTLHDSIQHDLYNYIGRGCTVIKGSFKFVRTTSNRKEYLLLYQPYLPISPRFSPKTHLSWFSKVTKFDIQSCFDVNNNSCKMNLVWITFTIVSYIKTFTRSKCYCGMQTNTDNLDKVR